MSHIQNEVAEKNSIEDAYRAPSIPERLPLAQAARFWGAFAVVVIGHAMIIAGMAVFRPFTETWWVGLAAAACGLVLACWIAKRIDLRMFPKSDKKINLFLILMIGTLAIVGLMLADEHLFKGYFIGGIKSILLRLWPFLLIAVLHIFHILGSLILDTMPRMPVDPSPRFTDRTRTVMQLAKDAAERLKQDVGSEHVLLGLVQEGKGVAANVLMHLGIDARDVVCELERLPASKSASPQSKNELGFIVQYAMEESTSLGHNYIGTEHLLLGLLRYRDGAAAEIMTKLGTSAEDVRQEVRNLLGLNVPLKL